MRLFVFALMLIGSLGSRQVALGQGTAPTTAPGELGESWTDAQRWAIACSAILCEANGRSHLLLGEVPKTPANSEMIHKEISAGLWNISNRQDLLDRLDWIDRAGQRKVFDDFFRAVEKMTDAEFGDALSRVGTGGWTAYRLKYVREHHTEVGPDGLLGFDYIRYISVCRSGYAAGYLSVDEAWQRIMPVARLLQKSYKSWEALSQNYILGRNFWMTTGQARFKKVVDKLLDEDESPWRQLPWQTDLGAGEPVHEPVFRTGK